MNSNRLMTSFQNVWHLCVFLFHIFVCWYNDCIGHEGKTNAFLLCWWLFVLLYFFFWPLCCLFFFDIRILIASLWYLQTLVAFLWIMFWNGVMRWKVQKHFRDTYVCGKAFDVFIKMTAFNFQSCLIFVSRFWPYSRSEFQYFLTQVWSKNKIDSDPGPIPFI